MRLIPLDQIAALDECMTAVDMMKVRALRATKNAPPIKLRRKNKHGFYVIDDGNHRTMAALLNRRTHIKANVAGSPFELSWRWPRVAPVRMTGDLLNTIGVL